MSENRKPADTLSLPDADIRRSIECLSFFLSTLRPGASQRHESNSMGSALTHFATLLSSKGCNVAVTGSISISGERPVSVPAFNGTISIAEHSRPSRDSVQSSEPRRYVIFARVQDSQGPPLKEKFEQALHKMSHAAVPPKEHVEDLLTLYSLFKNNLVDSNMAMRFIHLRALPQLRARFGAYKHLWKKDLFTTLEEWTPQSQDAYFSIRVRNLRHSHPEWISLLDRRGYPKAKTGDPNARYVQFSSTECQELLRFLVWCLRRAIQQAESNNLDIVISNILIVHAIVQDDAIESLFTRTSLHNILRSEEKHPAVEQFRTSDDGFIELHEQNEDEEDERQEIESIEADDAFRNLAYPRRYFKAITAWCAATAYFFRPNARVTSGTFELLIFRKAKPRSEASLVEAHDFLRHRLETRWSADDLKLRLAFLQQKFDQKKTMQFTSYVHAEAAIMVYHCNRDKQDIMPVGVSKKCCYLCFRLRQHLEEHGWGKIWVAGTHGIIYEWSPPPFNIPTAVLRNLEDELLVVLWREAEQYLYRQSLPNTPDNQYHVISTWVDEWD